MKGNARGFSKEIPGKVKIMDEFERLCVKIKEARVKNGYSQEKLAEVLGVSPTHIKFIESGRRKPSVETLFALARELSLSLDEIIFDRENRYDVSLEKELTGCSTGEKIILADIARILKVNRNIN